MDYQLLERQSIYKGKKIQVEVHRLADADGKRFIREMVVHPGGVVILPFVSEDTVLLIRQRRYVVGQYLIELPAGTLEKGEDPMNCAGRELLEETGYLAGRLAIIGSFFSSPGFVTEKMYAFAAYDLEKQGQALEEGEEIEVLPVPFAKAVEMIAGGEIADAKTIATLLMFERFGGGKASGRQGNA